MKNPTIAASQGAGVMRLSDLPVGLGGVIRAVEGAGCERLRSMGFCEQMRVRKLGGGRNLLCIVCGARLAISRCLAEQVLVDTRG